VPAILLSTFSSSGAHFYDAAELANRDVALLGDATFIVYGGAGLMSPRRQAKMSSDRSRSREAPRIVDADFEGKGCNAARRSSMQNQGFWIGASLLPFIAASRPVIGAKKKR
jgi:hypothetical protein